MKNKIDLCLMNFVVFEQTFSMIVLINLFKCCFHLTLFFFSFFFTTPWRNKNTFLQFHRTKLFNKQKKKEISQVNSEFPFVDDLDLVFLICLIHREHYHKPMIKTKSISNSEQRKSFYVHYPELHV